jgi:hypothetical protein
MGDAAATQPGRLPAMIPGASLTRRVIDRYYVRRLQSRHYAWDDSTWALDDGQGHSSFWRKPFNMRWPAKEPNSRISTRLSRRS